MFAYRIGSDLRWSDPTRLSDVRIGFELIRSDPLPPLALILVTLRFFHIFEHRLTLTTPVIEVYCPLIALSQYLNISDGLASQFAQAILVPNKDSAAGFVPLVSSSLIMLILRPEESVSRLTLLNPTFWTQTVGFGSLVTPVQNTNMSGYFKPFDLLTWIFLSVSLLFLTVISKILRQLDPQNTRFNWSDLVFTFFSQCSIQISSFHLNFKIICILPLWYFATVILSEMYKGELLSMMTIPTIPKAPETLDQIPDFEYFNLFTTHAIPYIERGAPRKHISYVKNLLQVVLKQESMTERRKILLTKVNQKLKFIPGPPKDVTFGMKLLLVNILVHYADADLNNWAS